jgi:hypothetical protein
MGQRPFASSVRNVWSWSLRQFLVQLTSLELKRSTPHSAKLEDRPRKDPCTIEACSRSLTPFISQHRQQQTHAGSPGKRGERGACVNVDNCDDLCSAKSKEVCPSICALEFSKSSTVSRARCDFRDETILIITRQMSALAS